MKSPAGLVVRMLALLAFAALLWGASAEFYAVAWGTGDWLGDFSLRWGILFFVFIFLNLILLLAAASVLWNPQGVSTHLKALARIRATIGAGRWLLALCVVLFPIWFLGYSPWGVVFGKIYVRLLIWLGASAVLAYLSSSHDDAAWTWNGILAGLVLSGAGFALAAPFGQVSNYPFALGWSEGNRLWDYSLLFGSHAYTYPVTDPPTAYLEPGRQLVGGLPFVLPHLSIQAERLWLAALEVLPYVVLGLLTFRPKAKGAGVEWMAVGLWGFIFLAQGPIHAPLLLCAILIVLAWEQSLWLAVLLVIASGYFAEISRYTWIFAPAIWAVMLEFGSISADRNRMPAVAWKRSIVVGLGGLFGSLILPRVLNFLHLGPSAQASAPGVAAGGVSVTTVAAAATRQPLLWYRLLPNATYGSGVLLGLVTAAAPLAIVLIYLLVVRQWKLNLLQKLALGLPLAVFLIVGLIISTKIGGGGDLHNLDMLLVGLLFATALAWRSCGIQWSGSTPPGSTWVRMALLLAIGLPAVQPLMALRPLNFAQDTNWLVVLTDAARPKDLGSLPSNDVTDFELQKLRGDITSAAKQGDVLFIDQRQLLTFGYVKNVQLVSEYEKKRMMDEALSGNSVYFHTFYQDLAAHRFALIVSDPLRTPIKDSDYGFGEENNAWVKWVARPVLCYYEEKDTLTNVRVQLLIPKRGAVDCSSELP